MKLFDLHCDTLSECYYHHYDLRANDELHISLDRAEKTYDKYAQLFAIYSRNGKADDDNFGDFFHILENAKSRLVPNDKFTPYLAVEGGKLLGGDIARLDVLYNAGVRFLTVVWGGDTCMGGAHDTDNGLTDFGRKAVKRCFELGIVPDVSHSSLKTFEEVYDMACDFGKPIIATHSNSRTIRDHARNLTDEQFRKIVGLKGLVGMNMYWVFLTANETCTVDTVVSHIEKFLLLGGEDVIAMGGDLDGIDHGPEGISGVQDMIKIADRLAQLNYSDELIDKIFYGNAASFMERNCIPSYPASVTFGK